MITRVARAALLFAVLYPSTEVQGQMLAGRIVEEGRDIPVPGAVVVLLDRAGEQKASAMADSVGRYRIRPPEKGDYVIEVTQFGYTTMRSPLIALEAEGSALLDLEVAPAPVDLQGLDVSVEREAQRELGSLGLTPSALGTRWMDREAIEAMPGLPPLSAALRNRGIAGASFPDDSHALCLQFRRGTGCAMIMLDGAPLPPHVALDLRLDEMGAMAVLTPSEATAMYGQNAAGGAILLWSR